VSSDGVRLRSASGLEAALCANGALRRLDCGDLTLNLFPGSELEGGPANLWLRRRGARIEWVPLLGPRSLAQGSGSGARWSARGAWGELHYQVSLVLAASATAWFWHVVLENRGRERAALDLLHAQDLALAHYGFLRNNEYYASHYVDYTPLAHPRHGTLLAVRQNLAMAGRQPWLALGSLGRAAGFATDALDFHGLALRAGADPIGLAADALPSRRRQHEHSLAVLQEEPFSLEPGQRAARGFFAWFEATHPDASGPADLACVERALALPEAKPPAAMETPPGAPPAASLFSARPVLACRDLRDDELAPLFGAPPREVERADGRVQSFFHGARSHVALRAKELSQLRPHGHLMRSGDRLVPDEASLTSTAWMAGCFHSLWTQGHVGINRLLSTQRGYLGLFRSHGQRIFAQLDGGWQLLDVPSAWEVDPDGCRWIYRHAGGSLEVRSGAARDRHALRLEIAVTDGPPRRFLVSHHVALAGDDGVTPAPVLWTPDAAGVAVQVPPGSELGARFPGGGFRIAPDAGTRLAAVGDDALLFADGRSRGEPFLVLVTEPARTLGFTLTAQLVADAATPQSDAGLRVADAKRFWPELTGALRLEARGALAGEVARLQEILPWFAHDAWIHYLAPRGLEQFSGGGWGTRDVCQGPVEWLLALGRWQPVRDLLLRVFRQQNPDGDWPQWFMFFERERTIRPQESHGDIVCWPLQALARYLEASEDASILAETLPFFDARGPDHGERATLWQHAERALALMERRVVPGTALAAYGHGDWNDSLQPVDPSLREHLCSAWTVALHHETRTLLAGALRRLGLSDRAAACEAPAPRIRAEFQQLIDGGVLAGFAHFGAGGRPALWMHPRDAETGIHYSLIAMSLATSSGLFTPEQAASHRDTTTRELLAPDGARLFDRPPRYLGGPQRHFQRAESSAYFGREMALMYTHAHLRHAEAMARLGDGEALFTALCQANPIGLRERVAMARPRQASCYVSSSDAVCADRYEAAARYDDVKAGQVPLEAGWRVYSSGPGIYLRLVRECLLGVRIARSRLGLDPVLPRALDGLRAELALDGGVLALEYAVRERGHGVVALALAGEPLAFAPQPSPYRAGGAEIPRDALRAALARGRARLRVELG
jgi:cellobiose phosphorylase